MKVLFCFVPLGNIVSKKASADSFGNGCHIASAVRRRFVRPFTSPESAVTMLSSLAASLPKLLRGPWAHGESSLRLLMRRDCGLGKSVPPFVCRFVAPVRSSCSPPLWLYIKPLQVHCASVCPSGAREPDVHQRPVMRQVCGGSFPADQGEPRAVPQLRERQGKSPHSCPPEWVLRAAGESDILGRAARCRF